MGGLCFLARVAPGLSFGTTFKAPARVASEKFAIYEKNIFLAKLKISRIARGGPKLGRVQGRSCSLGVIFGALAVGIKIML